MAKEEICSIIKLPEKLGDFEKGTVAQVGPICLKALEEHYKDLEYMDHTKYIYDAKPLDLEYFLQNSGEFKEAFKSKPLKDKPISEMQWEILDLRSTKQTKKISEYLVKHFLAKNKVYTIRDDKKAEVWIYQEGVYISEGRTYIMEFVREVLEGDYKADVNKEVTEKIMVDTFINPDKFFAYDTDVHLIPVQNGLLNLNTRELLDFDDTKVFFNKLPMIYDVNAKCPNIIKFLNDVCRDKSDVATLQEFTSTCLERRNKYDRMVMIIGGGRNGKTKFAELKKRFLGTVNCAGMQPSSFENPDSFNTHTLHGKLVNMYMDISKTAFKNTSLLKSLSGGDEITVPRKYKTSLTFSNTAKFIFGANELPHSYDLSNGFWERWFLIDFPYTFAYQNKIDTLSENEKHLYKPRVDDIIEKVCSPAELSGMLNWVLDGRDRLMEKGVFSYMYTPDQVKSMWIRKSDSFAAFFMDYMEIDYDEKVTKSEVRRAYVDYCKEHKLKVHTDKHISKVMTEEGAITTRVRFGELDENLWEGACFRKPFRKASEDLKGFYKFKKPTSKEEIKAYIEKNEDATKQDLFMKFGKKTINSLLLKGYIMESRANKVILC